MPKSALEHQAPHATRRVSGTIRVRATKRGFYDNHMKEPGVGFTLRDMEEFHDSWMELVDGSARERAETVAAWRVWQIEQMRTTTDADRAAKAEAERRAKAAAKADLQAIDDEPPAEKSENDTDDPPKTEPKGKEGGKSGKPAEKSENDVL